MTETDLPLEANLLTILYPPFPFLSIFSWDYILGYGRFYTLSKIKWYMLVTKSKFCNKNNQIKLTSCNSSFNFDSRSSWDLVGRYLASHVLNFHITFKETSEIRRNINFLDITVKTKIIIWLRNWYQYKQQYVYYSNSSSLSVAQFLSEISNSNK